MWRGLRRADVSDAMRARASEKRKNAPLQVRPAQARDAQGARAQLAQLPRPKPALQVVYLHLLVMQDAAARLRRGLELEAVRQRAAEQARELLGGQREALVVDLGLGVAGARRGHACQEALLARAGDASRLALGNDARARLLRQAVEVRVVDHAALLAISSARRESAPREVQCAPAGAW